MSLFEHISATDDSERVSHRKSAAVADQRFRIQFLGFLKGASSREELAARWDLVEGDFREMVASVCDEYGGDPKQVEAQVREALNVPSPGPALPGLGLDTGSPQGFDMSGVPGAAGDAVQGVGGALQTVRDIPVAGDVAAKLPGAGLALNAPGAIGDIGNAIGDVGGALGFGSDPTLQGNLENPMYPSKSSKLAAIDPQKAGQAIAGLFDDIASIYGGLSAPVSQLQDVFSQFEWSNPDDVLRSIAGAFDDVYSEWGEGDEQLDYALDVVSDFDYWSPEEFFAFCPSCPQPSGGDYFDGQDAAMESDEFGGGSWEDQQNAGMERGGSTAPLVRTARRPKMCPYHNELTDASLQAGEPQYAAFSGLVGGPSHCKGGFDGKCNFKPEMVTQAYWDGKAAEADQRRQEREQQKAEEINSIPEADAVQEPEVLEEGDGVTDLGADLEDAPSAVGEQPFTEAIEHEPMALAASTKTSEADRDGGGAVKRETLPIGNEDAMKGPSPEMDKSKWTNPKNREKSNLKPIDTEMEGSRNPTIQQTLWEHRPNDEFAKDYDIEPELGDTSGLTSQDLPTAGEEGGDSTEKNISQDGQGGTFNSTGIDANPVTNESLEGKTGNVDPAKIHAQLEQLNKNLDRAMNANDVNSAQIYQNRIRELAAQLESSSGQNVVASAEDGLGLPEGAKQVGWMEQGGDGRLRMTDMDGQLYPGETPEEDPDLVELRETAINGGMDWDNVSPKDQQELLRRFKAFKAGGEWETGDHYGEQG
jgi:hypothetical protein